MDWLDPSVEFRPSATSTEDLFQQDLLHLDLPHNSSHKSRDEDFPLVCSGAIIHCHAHTIHSSEPFTYGNDELIRPTENTCIFDKDDIHSSRSSRQHSTFGCESASLLSHVQLDGSDTDSFMSETQHLESDAGNEECISTVNKVYNCGRRSYSLGNSNSKNAIAARDNRLRKKKYITSLEESVRHLRAENERLQDQSKKTSNTVHGLQNEISYLRRVIANQSTLSAVLKNVIKTPGIMLSTAFSNTSQIIQKEGRLIPDCRNHCCNYISNSSEENSSGPSYVRAKPDIVNSLSESNQNATSYPFFRKNSERNAGKKKTLVLEEIRKKYDTEKEDAATDGENSAELTASAVSFPPDSDISGGICLHVSGQNVSLEFCSHCNTNAHLGLISDHSYVKV